MQKKSGVTELCFGFVWSSLGVKFSGKLTLKKVPKTAIFRQKVKGFINVLTIWTIFLDFEISWKTASLGLKNLFGFVWA